MAKEDESLEKLKPPEEKPKLAAVASAPKPKARLATKVAEEDRKRVLIAHQAARLLESQRQTLEAQAKLLAMEATLHQSEYVRLLTEMGTKYGGDFLKVDALILETGDIQRGALLAKPSPG